LECKQIEKYYHIKRNDLVTNVEGFLGSAYNMLGFLPDGIIGIGW
jgi:hypothetical protein